MRVTETLKKINTTLMSMGDIPKDIFVFLAILLIVAGVFMVGRISVGETERKNGLKIVAPSNLSANAEQVLLEANSSSTGQKIGSFGSTSQRSYTSQNQIMNVQVKSGMYVGTKNGRVYHLPSCGGAKKIKLENQVWFIDKRDAEAKGYKPAANCKGI